MSDWREKRREEYVQKLKDPRWQKLRLQIFNRDGWKCRDCDSPEKTLNVHHRYYLDDADPWEYPDAALLTLCSDCHETETVKLREQERLLVQVFKKAGFRAVDFALLAEGFSRAHPSITAGRFLLTVYDLVVDEDLRKRVHQFIDQLRRGDAK